MRHAISPLPFHALLIIQSITFHLSVSNSSPFILQPILSSAGASLVRPELILTLGRLLDLDQRLVCITDEVADQTGAGKHLFPTVLCPMHVTAALRDAEK